jgi:hypothetical protein
MKKIIAMVIAIASISYASDKTFSIAGGTASQSITNTTSDQVWYIKGLYGLKGAASSDVVSLIKVSGANEIVIGYANMTATSTDVNVVIPIRSVVALRSGEVLKISRTNTGSTLKGFISTSGEEGITTVISADLTGNLVGNVSGSLVGTSVTADTITAGAIGFVQEVTTSRVLTASDYGKFIIINTNAAVAVTLPSNGTPAGVWINVAVHGSASDACAPTISAASADTLIGPNDVDLDSVTWGTGHRIGAQAKFWSDGTLWHVQNLGGTTMTYTD